MADGRARFPEIFLNTRSKFQATSHDSKNSGDIGVLMQCLKSGTGQEAATLAASTNAVGPRYCVPQLRQPSSARPARPTACGDAGVKLIALQHGVVLLTTGMTTAGYSEPWLLWMLAAYAGTSASSSPKPYVTERPSILP
jgi:hypothetical protein